MNRINNYEELKQKIISWIKDYVKKNNIDSLVVGVSGGIDSAVVSTLCAETNIKTYVLNMPIHQNKEQEDLSDLHINFLSKKYSNIEPLKFNLSNTFDSFLKDLSPYNLNKLANANSRSRIRMVCLYQIAGNFNGIVVGTGNKIEDYGIGFYTKYGDGGVDIAPIADLYKTEVWELGKVLGVDNKIIDAKPTDGLWDDGRSDEDQIGCSYEDLEWAMEIGKFQEELNKNENKILNIYNNFHNKNKHKMESIPTFKLQKIPMNKFFTTDDYSSDVFKSKKFDFALKNEWWSRKYEYPFALEFARGIVLDAACGIEHPFKIALLDKAIKVYACDHDEISKENVISRIKSAFNVDVSKDIEDVEMIQSGIENLPFENEKFDTIFCISVIEHLNTDTLQQTLYEFYRTLKKDGTVVLTVDYPVIDPLILLEYTKQAGFIINGEYNYSIPENAINWSGLKCFSMILKKQ